MDRKARLKKLVGFLGGKQEKEKNMEMEDDDMMEDSETEEPKIKKKSMDSDDEDCEDECEEGYADKKDKRKMFDKKGMSLIVKIGNLKNKK